MKLFSVPTSADACYGAGMKRRNRPTVTHGCVTAIRADFSAARSSDENDGTHTARERLAAEVFVQLLSSMRESFPSSTHAENMSWLQAAAFREIRRKNPKLK